MINPNQEQEIQNESHIMVTHLTFYCQ